MSDHCRGCGAPIKWVTTPAGKRMPQNPDGTNHFVTCLKRDEFARPSDAVELPESQTYLIPHGDTVVWRKKAKK